LLLVLDGVTDPHNLGACLRTADAAGVHALVIPRIEPPRRRGGAQGRRGRRRVRPGRERDQPGAGSICSRNAAIWVVGTDGEAPQTLYEADLKRPLALVLGAEGGGMRRLTRERCDFVVRIPMAGQVRPERLGGDRGGPVRGAPPTA
jgi:23S rRNA (guanosine2251-2'-O)-methyltransferase